MNMHCNAVLRTLLRNTKILELFKKEKQCLSIDNHFEIQNEMNIYIFRYCAGFISRSVTHFHTVITLFLFH